jgi:uncharacterized OsmC-like protein
MKARIKWVEDRTFVGDSGSGHKIVLGTAFGPEGRSPGPSPMELVLIGLGGCSGYDVVHILEKGRQASADVAGEGAREAIGKPIRQLSHRRSWAGIRIRDFDLHRHCRRD